MQNYFLLVLLVVAAVVALWLFIALCVWLFVWTDRLEHPDPFMEWVWRLAPVVAGALLIASASGALHLYRHLADQAPHVLQEFAVWYAFGLGSRFLLLWHRREILDKVFATDWDRVVGAFFIAVFGPLVTVHTIRRIWVERNPPWG